MADYSIVTGNGFVGNAQRCEYAYAAPNGFYQIVYFTGQTVPNFALSFKYRTNDKLNVAVDRHHPEPLDWQYGPYPTVTGDAEYITIENIPQERWREYTTGYWWIAVGFTFNTLSVTTGDYIEVDEVNFYKDLSIN